MTRAKVLELLFLSLFVAAAAAAVPLSTGYMAWSWDALNHHIYLGMTAEHSRWHLDVIPASYQTYQYPYLYWPIYRLSLLDGSGAVVGAILSAFQAAMLLPPVWLIADRLLPDSGAVLADVLERVSACVLAFLSLIILASLETTANDALAAVPMLWAVALTLRERVTTRLAFAASALWGVSTAFKFSNGLFMPWLLLWWWASENRRLSFRQAQALFLGAVIGFGLAYAPWGWQLWRLTGNPFFPYFTFVFGRG